MTVVRGFLIVITSGIIGALAGMGIGFSLGKFAPDYYRTVFRISEEAEINPIQTGIGLGLTQGVTAGLFVGLVIVVSVACYNSRQNEPTNS